MDERNEANIKWIQKGLTNFKRKLKGLMDGEDSW